MPQISVIVPIYNVEPYIRRCVDSILAQTFTDFELILIDDGSPDNCLGICDEYADYDKRVHVIHQENSGLSAARNTGIDWAFTNSNSEWITFIDSDDWVSIHYLEVLYQGVKDNKTSVSICGFLRTKGDINPEDNGVSFQITTPEAFYVKDRTNFIIAWGKLYNKNCFADIRYPVGKIHEDEYVTYKILFAYERIAFTERPLYYYYINESGIMNSSPGMGIISAIDAIQKQLIFFKRSKKKNAYNTALLHYIGTLSALLKQTETQKTAIKRIKREIYKHPLKLKFFINNAPWACELSFPLFMKAYWIIKSKFS